MKGIDLFRHIASDDLKTVGVKLNVGGAIEIDLDTAQRLVAGNDYEAVCSVRCRVQGAGVNAKHGAVVEMKLLKDTFDITDVEAPVYPPATEPMLGPDGEVLIGDVVSAVVDAMDGAVVDGDGVHLRDPSDELDAATHHPFKKGSPDPAMCKVCGNEKAAPVHQNPGKAKVEALPDEQVNEG